MLVNYARLFRAQKRNAEASELEKRTVAILAAKGKDNPGEEYTVDYRNLTGKKAR